MSDEKVEPIERLDIRVYDCPLCDERIIGTLEEARAHVNIPLGRGLILPRGFTFGKRDFLGNEGNNTIYVVVTYQQLMKREMAESMRCSDMGGVSRVSLETTHDFRYTLDGYYLEDGVWRLSEVSFEYSHLLSEGFRKRGYFLLTAEQFENFKEKREVRHVERDLPDKYLVITVSGIERFLGREGNG